MRIDADIMIPKVDRVAVMATDKIAIIPVAAAPSLPVQHPVAAEANDNRPALPTRAVN